MIDEIRQTIRIQKALMPALVFVAAILLFVFNPQPSFAENKFAGTRFIGGDDMPWHISAKRLTYDKRQGCYIAEGDVVITKNGQSLRAQNVVYDMKSGIARLSGDVRMDAGGDILTGDGAIIDLNNQTGRITDGCLFLKDNHYYVRGAVMEKLGEDTYMIKDCRLTTCDGVKPDWTIAGSEVKVTVEGYGTVKHASFRARGLPILYVPYMIFPAKTKRQTGLLVPRMGYSGRNGVDAEVPFFWAVSDQTDATFYQRFMGKRGYMQGLEFRYLAKENSKGIFLFDILSDKIREKNMNDPDEAELSPYDRTNRTRYWIRSRADQDLPVGIVARMDVDFVSDQDYLKEFENGLFGFEARQDLAGESRRPLAEKHSPTRRSALRLSRDGEEYSLQALAGYYQRPENPPEDDMAQPLGGLNFAALPKQIWKLPAFFSVESDYDYVWRDEGQKGHRVSISPELRVPLWLFGKYMEFEPSIRYTFNKRWLHNPQEGKDREDVSVYEAGARLSAGAERIYDFEWANVKKLKHRILPVLSYTYRGHQDEKINSPWFEPVEEEGHMNQISLSVENYLDARLENEKGRVTYHQWATLKLSQGYDIAEARIDEEKKEPFTPLSAILTVSPFADLDLRATADWDHYAHKISKTTLSLDLSIDRSGGREDTLQVDYLYRKDIEKSLDLWVDVTLVYGFSIGCSLERDMEIGHNISNSYWVGYESQCWGVKLGMRREDKDTSVMVVFNLLGLGEFSH